MTDPLAPAFDKLASIPGISVERVDATTDEPFEQDPEIAAINKVVEAAEAWRDRASSDFPEGWYRLCEAVDELRRLRSTK